MNISTFIDDPVWQAKIGAQLTENGVCVEHSIDEDDAEEHLASGLCEIMVLCLSNVMDAADFLSLMRRKGHKHVFGVINRGGQVSDDTRIALLECGADSIVSENDNMRVFRAEIDAALRRTSGLGSKIVESGPLKVDLTRTVMTINDKRVSLSPKQWSLVECLALNFERTVVHSRILDHLYGFGDAPDSNILPVMVSHIRWRIEEAGGDPRQLQTVNRVGYRLAPAEPAKEGSLSPREKLLRHLALHPMERRRSACAGAGIEGPSFDAASQRLRREGLVVCVMERRGWFGRWSLTDAGVEYLRTMDSGQEGRAA